MFSEYSAAGSRRADCERGDSDRRKNAAEASRAQTVEHRKVHRRSRNCDDEPTPAFFHLVELGGPE